MSEENHIEIYRQRYETFRHLDKLRWQMFQILVAIASTTALVLRVVGDGIEWWFLLLLGTALVLVAWVSDQISAGIRKNNAILKAVATKIGDDGIPDMQIRWRSITYWVWRLVWLLGILLIISSFSE